MSLDTLTLQAVVFECGSLPGSTLLGVEQTGSNEVALEFVGPGGRDMLVISVQPEYARLYRTAPSRHNSAQSSAFVSAVREHLLRSTLLSIERASNDRIVTMRFDKQTTTEHLQYRIIAELISRQSMLVLVEEPSLLVIETLRRVRTGDREIFPGEQYVLPPVPEKTPLAAVSMDELSDLLDLDTPDGLIKALVRRIGGMSPTLARELVGAVGLLDAAVLGAASRDERRVRMQAELEAIQHASRNNEWMPMLGLDEAGRPSILSPIPIASIPPERVIVCATMSEAIRRFYDAKIERDRLHVREMQARRALTDEVAKLERLAANLAKDLTETEREEEFRRDGDLLTAQLSTLKRGQTEALIPDLFSTDQRLVRIVLDPALSPADNAKGYFKRAKKAKDGRLIMEHRQQQTQERLARVRSVLEGLGTSAGMGAVERAHRECVRLGLLKEARPPSKPSGAHSQKKERTLDIHPRRFVTTDGMVVLVGRNDKENEVLTKSAAPEDIWFHARDMGGSHVILRREGRKDMPSRQACYEAAGVAAYFSKGRTSTTVPIDYTERRYVRKQRNGGPGQVIFTHEKTLFVEPKLIQEQDERVGGLRPGGKA